MVVVLLRPHSSDACFILVILLPMIDAGCSCSVGGCLHLLGFGELLSADMLLLTQLLMFDRAVV